MPQRLPRRTISHHGLLAADVHKYDGRIYINGEKHRDDLVECVGVMKKEFGDWLANAGIFFNRTKVQVRCPDSCDGRFDTLEEAIALVYDGLEDPEKLLRASCITFSSGKRKIGVRIFPKSSL